MTAIKNNEGSVFFAYSYGGTGKTYIWKTLYVAVRCNAQIILNVVSSGIASLLLTGGKTSHSQFIIPLVLTDDFVCSITPDSELVNLLKKNTSLIIWD